MDNQLETDRPTGGLPRMLYLSLVAGAILAVVIFSAFCWIDSVQEELVMDATREKARDFVDAVMLKVHWQAWETDPTKKEFLKEMMRDLPNQQYDAKILGLPDAKGVIEPLRADADDIHPIVFGPEAGWETTQLQSLRAVQSEHVQQFKTQPRGNTFDERPRFVERRIQGNNSDEYHYYQAAYFKKSCINCHAGMKVAIGAAPDAAKVELPFRAVKVVMKYTETQQAIDRTRATLMTVAILILAVSTVAIYGVVRFFTPEGS